MSPLHVDPQQTYIGTIDQDGRRYNVSVRTHFDGVEHVGRLFFADDGADDTGLPDRGSLPGRTREDVLAMARRMTPQDLVLRYRRAVAEKRRYTALRDATNDVLAKIRYLNQVAISMRAGLLDMEGAAQEIALTERQLHEIVDRLRVYAGVEDETP